MFKGIYVRALVALYRLTTKDSDKEAIRAIIKDSVNAMVRNACDKEWHCNGDWDRGGTMQDALDQSVSSSLLVAASGIFGSNTDDGFRPKVLRKRSRRAQRIDKAT